MTPFSSANGAVANPNILHPYFKSSRAMSRNKACKLFTLFDCAPFTAALPELSCLALEPGTPSAIVTVATGTYPEPIEPAATELPGPAADALGPDARDAGTPSPAADAGGCADDDEDELEDEGRPAPFTADD